MRSLNLKRAQEMIERNKLKREMLSSKKANISNKDDMYH